MPSDALSLCWLTAIGSPMTDEWSDRVMCEGTGVHVSRLVMIAQRPDKRRPCSICGLLTPCDWDEKIGWIMRPHYRKQNLADSPWIDNGS